MKNMRPRIDTTTPPTCRLDHLRNNAKKEQLLEDRYHEIDKANRILVQKMSDIMKGPGPVTQTERFRPRSLTTDTRRKELQRITQENQGILKRIQKVQPVYSHTEWEDSFRRSNGYLRIANEYPLALPRHKSRPGSASTGSLPKAIQDSSSWPQGGSGSARQAQEEDLRYVLKEGKELDRRYYLVEMATDGRALWISAYDGEHEQNMELMVNERNHRRLYRDAMGDYSTIASRLRVEGGKLVLESGGGGPFDLSLVPPP
jgi:E3 ubiquitin-protein ligase TRIP12